MEIWPLYFLSFLLFVFPRMHTQPKIYLFFHKNKYNKGFFDSKMKDSMMKVKVASVRPAARMARGRQKASMPRGASLSSGSTLGTLEVGKWELKIYYRVKEKASKLGTHFYYCTVKFVGAYLNLLVLQITNNTLLNCKMWATNFHKHREIREYKIFE